jgi:hypothetical protein
MDKASTVNAMSGQSATNGWDAICALNAQRVNSIFFQQYLQDGPTNPATPLRVILQGEGTNFWALDIVAGPPEVTFPTNLSLQQVQVTMFLVRGALIEFDPNQMVITSAILIDANESWITGALNLEQVTGTGNTLGQVVVDLGSNAYQPQVKGVDPDSVLATDIGTALKTFFAHNATKYPLGTLMETGVPACLQPTHFSFVNQPAPGSNTGDGCVLLLIRTNGSGGTIGQLATYPIPDGQTVALIVSNQVIFNQLMPVQFTQELQNLGTTFSGKQTNGVWQTVSSGGSINLPVLGNTQAPGSCLAQSAFTSDGQTNPAGVAVSTDGFVIAPASGSLSVAWNHTWTQQWACWSGLLYKGWCRWMKYLQTSTLAGSYSQTSAPTVDPTTDIVSFSGSGTVSLNQTDAPAWWQKLFFGAEDIPSQFTAAIQPTLQAVFNAVQVPAVNTFALANLLFPSLHVLNLQQASLPCDLLLNGQLQQRLSISPSTVDLEPGQTQQFTAMSAGQPVTNVLWELKPTLGSITSSGLYTAPGSVARAEVVVVTAISQSDASLVGSAMVLVYRPVPATGLVVSPANLILTAGQSFNLLVTDESGTPVAANCTLNPNVGQIAQGWQTGEWTYTAPSPVTASTPVTVTATSTANPSQTGTGTVNLTPTEKIQITPPSSSISGGQTLQLKATPADLTEYRWQIFPYGTGSITPDASDDSQATYAAPSTVPSVTEVMVAAYSLGDSAGIGLARVTVNPS